MSFGGMQWHLKKEFKAEMKKRRSKDKVAFPSIDLLQGLVNGWQSLKKKSPFKIRKWKGTVFVARDLGPMLQNFFARNLWIFGDAITHRQPFTDMTTYRQTTHRQYWLKWQLTDHKLTDRLAKACNDRHNQADIGPRKVGNALERLNCLQSLPNIVTTRLT